MTVFVFFGGGYIYTSERINGVVETLMQIFCLFISPAITCYHGFH